LKGHGFQLCRKEPLKIRASAPEAER
jgi:hypothetical protein